MISFTTSLFFGMDDALRNQFPRNIEVRGSEMTQEQSQQLIQTLDHAVESSEIPTENLIYYRYLSIGLQKQGNDFYRGEYTPADSEYCLIYMIPLAEYNRLQDSPLPISHRRSIGFYCTGRSTISWQHSFFSSSAISHPANTAFTGPGSRRLSFSSALWCVLSGFAR